MKTTSNNISIKEKCQNRSLSIYLIGNTVPKFSLIRKRAERAIISPYVTPTKNGGIMLRIISGARSKQTISRPYKMNRFLFTKSISISKRSINENDI